MTTTKATPIVLGGLTTFQREEVEHLLTVAEEAFQNEETTDKPWGSLSGATLTVTDWRGARDDLNWRADWHISEADNAGKNGHPAARSLATLADRIYDAVPEADRWQSE